jgi:RNA polymerase sigma factor (TIGR02999 family)
MGTDPASPRARPIRVKATLRGARRGFRRDVTHLPNGATVGEFTRLITEGADADGVPVDALWSAAYSELKLLAHSRLYHDGQSTLLDTTSLVNESYVKLAGVKTLRIDDRRRFFAYASRVMRSVIVDLVRERMSQRRGGGAEHLGLTMTIADPGATDEPLRIHDALRELAVLEPRISQVVEMRYFGGLSDPEIAEILDVTVRTVGRDWDKARLLLREMLGP